MKTSSQKKVRFYYLAGCDGTGKTTLTGLLSGELARTGAKCQQLWLRFPFMLSVPLLAFARWRGYSWYESYDAARTGYWDFSHSWVMRSIFPWVLLLDASLAAVVRVYIPIALGRTIICERFTLDMLADLMVAIKDNAWSARLPARLFVRLLPARTRVAILDLDAATIRRRRPSLVNDRLLPARLEAFKALAAQYHLPVIDNHRPLTEVFNQVSEVMELQ